MTVDDRQLEMVSPLDAPRPAVSSRHVVQAIVQFGHLLHYRRKLVLGTVAACAILGTVYYGCASRYYQTQATLLVLQAGADVASPSMTDGETARQFMPTNERLLQMPVVLKKALSRLSPEERGDLGNQSAESAVQALRSNLSVKSTRGTNLIEVSYVSRQPRAAVAVINSVVQAYLDFMDETHAGTARQILDVLTREKSSVETRLREKEEELRQIRQDIQDLGIREGGKVVHPALQRAVRLNEELMRARQERLAAQASLATIQHTIQQGGSLDQHLLNLEESLGRTLLLSGLGFDSRENQMRASLEKTLLTDQAELDSKSKYLGPNHPEVQEIRRRMELTRQYLQGYQTRLTQQLQDLRQTELGPLLVRMAEQRLAQATEHERGVRAGFEQARDEAVRLHGDLAQLEIVEHDLKWLRELRDVLLNRIANIDLRRDEGEIRTTVVREPALPSRPFSPQGKWVAVASLGLGLLLGCAAVYIEDILDDRFRASEELRVALQVPVLAEIRRWESSAAAGPAKAGADALIVKAQPQAVESEAIRSLRTVLAFSHRDASRLVVSSAEPGDGKTTVLSNLGLVFAQSRKRTLLIDSDLRRPGLTTLWELRGESGLSSVLQGEDAISDMAARYVRDAGVAELDVLPAGPRVTNPTEWLLHPRFSELLEWADKHYDMVLVDSPPILVASDAAVAGRLADGMLLVVQPEKNRRRVVTRAVERLTALDVDLLGVVANAVPDHPREGKYGYGENYGYQDEAYGADFDGDEADSPVHDKKTPPAKKAA